MPLPRDALRMSEDDLESLLATTRTMRVGTVSPDGWPHVVPLWFVWHDGVVWVNNLRRTRRSRDLARGSPAALCIDDGIQYAELRGAVLYGRFEEATGDPRLDRVRRAFGEKYFGALDVPDLKSHVWLRLEPDRIVTWDFAKIPAGRDKRLEAARENGL